MLTTGITIFQAMALALLLSLLIRRPVDDVNALAEDGNVIFKDDGELNKRKSNNSSDHDIYTQILCPFI